MHAILEDRRRNLWLSTNQGMVKFNTSTLTYQTFKHTNELKITEFSDGAFFRDEVTGSLLFGGVNGFITIHENEYAQKEYLPSIAFNRLSIFGKEHNIYDFLTEKKGKHVLELDYSQNFFSVTFTAIDYLHGNDYTYFYKLDELNDNWIENGSSNNAAFTNISPGQYTLSVKYRNNLTGHEGETEQLSIKIIPPWYLTRIAYSIYSLLCMGLILLIFLFSRNGTP
ncbi:MAG: hypothetical protein LUE93_00665 [Bacteroides sp.]|nr:hypothetical protein [Bacteroides sp.]